MNETTTNVSEQLDAIQDQLTSISEELVFIRRTRQEVEDLKNDLQFVLKDVFQTVVQELEEVSQFIKAGEATVLTKRLIRNIGTFNEIIGQLDSARDFIADAQPLGKDLFHDGLVLMDDLEKKGYFDYAKELKVIMDNIVDHFSLEDVNLLAENIVTILETIKSLTQPEMLQAVNNAASIFQKLDPGDIEEYSLFRLMREANSKEMRRAMGLFFTFLKRMSSEYEQR